MLPRKDKLVWTTSESKFCENSSLVHPGENNLFCFRASWECVQSTSPRDHSLWDPLFTERSWVPLAWAPKTWLQAPQEAAAFVQRCLLWGGALTLIRRTPNYTPAPSSQPRHQVHPKLALFATRVPYASVRCLQVPTDVHDSSSVNR